MTLPNFIVIGAGKSGTTSLYQWLRRHPQVFMPAELKEVRFFAYDPDDRYSEFPVKTLAEYEALFEHAGAARAIGEASPRYLESDVAPANMRAVIPDARLIASLREPVARVYSMAQMFVRGGRASGVVQEVRRLAASGYGGYAPLFERWLSHYPREQFLVFKYDDLAADADGVLRRVFQFLDVDDDFEVNTAVVYNPGGAIRSPTVNRVLSSSAWQPLRNRVPASVNRLAARLRRWNARPPEPLPDGLRQELKELYRPDVIATQDLLGLDLSAWLT